MVKLAGSPPRTTSEIPALTPPVSGDPVYIAFLGPVLNTGEQMRLRQIRWVGRKAILSVDVWRDGEGRRRNIPHIPLLIVPLKEGSRSLSEPGKYEVEVEWSLLFSPTINDGLYSRYSPDSIADAPVPAPMKKSFLAVAKAAGRAEFEISE